jgi:hypothetical protein
LYVRHNRFSQLVKELDTLRQNAEEHDAPRDEITLADQPFLVLPFGGKARSGRRSAYFRWQLQSASGFVLQLMKQENWQGSLPNAKLVASSLVIMRLGIDQVVKQAFAALDDLGAKVDHEKVSRVDVCCDLPGRSIVPLKQAFDAGHYVSRAKGDSEFGTKVEVIDTDYSIYSIHKKVTSFNLGRGAVRMRVYEKVLECIRDVEKLGAMIAHRWGMLPAEAVRAEFQLRRTKLTELGVDSLADWLEKRSAIVRYLVESWFRLTDGPVDRKHPDRTPILPAWREVQDAFAAWTGSGPPVDLGPIATQLMPPEHYIKSIVGSFVSLFARLGVKIDGNETFWNEGLYRILDEIEKRDMAAEVARRALELGIASPSHHEGDESNESAS